MGGVLDPLVFVAFASIKSHLYPLNPMDTPNWLVCTRKLWRFARHERLVRASRRFLLLFLLLFYPVTLVSFVATTTPASPDPLQVFAPTVSFRRWLKSQSIIIFMKDSYYRVMASCCRFRASVTTLITLSIITVSGVTKVSKGSGSCRSTNGNVSDHTPDGGGTGAFLVAAFVAVWSGVETNASRFSCSALC